MTIKFESLPDPVVLSEGNASWNTGRNSYEGFAQIKLFVQPRTGIRIICRFKGLSEEDKLLICLGAFEAHQTLSFNGQDVPGFHLSADSEDEDIILHWSPEKTPLQIELSPLQSLARLQFHLFSFFEIKRPNGQIVTLEDDEWEITLRPVSDISAITRKIQTDGLSRLSHIGEMKRKDGNLFKPVEVQEQLQLLRYFMALVRGTWCDPICNLGFDSDGTEVWQSFGAPHNSSSAISSWFDYFHPEQMTTLYPLFSEKWKSSEDWKSCIREVIYWYTNANTAGGTPGIDVSILLSQTALERLSFQYSVVDRQFLSAKVFKSPQNKASDKLRRLLTTLQIPVAIPASLQDMSSAAGKLKWEDGPHAFSEIRNALVHPDSKNRQDRFKCIVDGWALGLWYVETAILAVCGYDGSYGSRLTRRTYGEVSPVPWSEKSNKSHS